MKKIPVVEITLVILGSLLYFLANMQRVAVPGAVFTLLQTDLHTTAQNIASLGASFMYVYAVTQLFIGILIAKYGGFRVVSIGAVLFFTGSLLFPLANSFVFLYLSRILIGIGSASFYLAMINETRKIVSHKNFGIALSFVLLIGYLGGIIANAPIVICINHLGWRKVFLLTAIISTVIALLFILINKFADKQPVNNTVHLNFDLYKQVFSDKRNIRLYLFACLNYALYYVIQTVIGKKFLEDFCSMTVINSALILSIMGFLYAVSGSVIAFMSKLTLNRRTIYLRFASLNTLFTFSSIFICLVFNIKNPIIPVILFCTIAFWASLSPLLVPLLHDINGEKVSSSAVSVMTCGFYLGVGLLGNVVGFCLDLFKNTGAYLTIFAVCTALAVIACLNVFKIEESAKTKRILHYVKNHGKIAPEDNTKHWHDKYEHDLYNNV
ncbi:MAG: MFS transporter [Candidatus Gastranaerophilales bacterium]|nr:MFS transporter [Candidatus Gastranaerophilales bacterium]